MTKIIAEIGWNHMGDMKLAKDMIAAANDGDSEVGEPGKSAIVITLFQ